MDLNAYFERIKYDGTTDPTIETLTQLHRAHLMAIPFENLDIHIPRPIILDKALLFEKLVNEKRGGFCFEHNGLFHEVLSQLGFDVQFLEANVHRSGDDYSISMGHMCLLATIDGVRYLADVGFGASFIDPLELDTTAIQVQGSRRFQVKFEGNTGYYYNQGSGEDNLSLGYRFFLEPHTLADYIEACDYTQTSPDIHFTQKRVCSQWVDTGRITLTDDKFILTTWDGERTETPIVSEAQFHQLLAEHFGITVTTIPPQKTEA